MHEQAATWTTSKCIWEECKTKSTFTTVKAWLDHVRIVHRKAFYCELEDCKYRRGGLNPKSFGSQADLRRHMLWHVVPVYCDKPGCTGRENINRRDKRSKHLYKYHGHIQCYYIDCPRRHAGQVRNGFSTHHDLVEHLEEMHTLLDNVSPDHETTLLFPAHEGNCGQQASKSTFQLPGSPRSLISDETWVDSGYGSQYDDREESPPSIRPPPFPGKAGAYPEGVEAWCRSQNNFASGDSPNPLVSCQTSTISRPPEMTEEQCETKFWPRQCPIEICRAWPTKDHFFMTSNDWQTHLKSVHSNSILCTARGCTAAPFGNKTDLNRHILNQHRRMWDAAKPYKCTRSDCVATIKAFARKDKFDAHNSYYHIMPLSKCATCHRYFNSTAIHDSSLCSIKHTAASGQEQAKSISRSGFFESSNNMTGIDCASKAGDTTSQFQLEHQKSNLDDSGHDAEDAAHTTDEWSEEESIEAEMSGTEDDLYEALYRAVVVRHTCQSRTRLARL